MTDGSKVAVYTCVTGDYDPIQEPEVVTDGVEYICFCSETVKLPRPWKRGRIPYLRLSDRNMSRYVKMFPHKLPELRQFDVTVYLDATIRVTGNIYGFLADHVPNVNSGVWMFDHPSRDCVYEEGWQCAYSAHDWIWNIHRQLKAYQGRGLPRHVGLTEAGAIVRFSSDASMPVLMEKWWEEYMRGAKRDQLSLPFASWTTGIPVQSMGKSDVRFRQRYFKFVPHRARRSPVRATKRFVNRAALKFMGDPVLSRPDARH
jgi:hypothetical protein